jgi:hypothetical protein
MKTWGPALTARRPDITMEMVDKFLTRMYRTNPDFVFTVTRDFVRNCQTPVLILPDDIPAHPYAVAMEAAMLAPNAEVSIFPWKEPKERYSTGGAPDTFLPPGTSPCFCIDAWSRVLDRQICKAGVFTSFLFCVGRTRLTLRVRSSAGYRPAR